LRESMITLCFPLICVKCNNVPAEKGTILKRGLKRCLELGPFHLKMSESVESGRRDNGVGSEGSRSLRLDSLLPDTPLSVLTHAMDQSELQPSGSDAEYIG